MTPVGKHAFEVIVKAFSPYQLDKYIIEGMVFKGSEYTHKQLKIAEVQSILFWARLASFGQLGLVSEPQIKFWKIPEKAQ